jgi:hypothetical protein
MRTKFIVTNVSRLKTKYGNRYARVDKAIQQLIAADAARNITTSVWDVSSTARMKEAGGKKVTKASDAKQNKDAVDAIFTHGNPDYLMLLGSVDVIPHQDLDNPMGDEDKRAWGDLPYACEHAYSKDVSDFIAPTRVVGRLPDLTGAKDPKHLVRVLGVAATWVPLAPSHYDDYFALSAEIWQKSTKLSIKKVFGSNENLFISPASGPKWPNGELKPLPHFINCHGASGRMSFYGEDASGDQPEAHRTTHVRNNIERGTVAAVECCYGAELYRHGTATSDKEPGICQEYLHDDAYAFFGSTTIAYGPAATMGQADIICAAFLKHVREGDSTGLAALKARQDFIKASTKFELDDQKTLAQFNLLGDPSIHPVQQGSKATKKNVAKPKGVLGLKSAVSVAEAQPTLDNRHRARRAQLAKRGPQIASQTIVARRTSIDADGAARAREAAGPYATEVVAAAVAPAVVRANAKGVTESAAANVASSRTYFVRVDPPRSEAMLSIKAKSKSKSQKAPPKILTYSVRVVEERPDGEMRVVREVFPK